MNNKVNLGIAICIFLLILLCIYFLLKNNISKTSSKEIDIDNLLDLFKSELDKNWKTLCEENKLDPLDAPDPNYPFLVDSTRLDGKLDDKPIWESGWWDSYIDGAGALFPPAWGVLPGNSSCLCCTGNANPYLFASHNAGVVNKNLIGLSNLTVRSVTREVDSIKISIGTTDEAMRISAGITGWFSIKYKCRKCAKIIWLCRDESEWKDFVTVAASNKRETGPYMRASVLVPENTEVANIIIKPSINPSGKLPYNINIEELNLNNSLQLSLQEDSYVIFSTHDPVAGFLTKTVAGLFTDVNSQLEPIVRDNVFRVLSGGILKNILSRVLNDLVNTTCAKLPDEYRQLCEDLNKTLTPNQTRKCGDVFCDIAPLLIQNVLNDIYKPEFNVNQKIKQNITGDLSKTELCESNSIIGKAISTVCTLLRKRPSTCGGGLYKINIDSVSNLDKIRVTDFIKQPTLRHGSFFIDFSLYNPEPMILTLSDVYMKLFCDCYNFLPIPIKCDDSTKYRNWYCGYKKANIEVTYNEPFISGEFEFTKHGTIILTQLILNVNAKPTTKIISTEQSSKSPFDDTPIENNATDKFADNKLVMSMIENFLLPSAINKTIEQIIPVIKDEISKISIDQNLLAVVFQCVRENIQGQIFTNKYNALPNPSGGGLVCEKGNLSRRYFPTVSIGDNRPRCEQACNQIPRCAGYSFNTKTMRSGPQAGAQQCVLQDDPKYEQCTVDDANKTPLSRGKGYTYYRRVRK